MFSSQEWWNGGAGVAPEPSFPIGQSLRFRGAQSLSRDGALCGESTTFSAWIKCTGEIASAQYITSLSQSDGTIVCQLLLNSGGNTFTAENAPSQFTIGSASYRDPGAWYHVVYTRGTNATRLFINGVEAPYATQTTGAGGAITSSNNPQRIGSVFNASGNFFEGYMADVYFIDGQALEPSVFGTLDDNGVWVPAKTNFAIGQSKYSDYLTGDYDPTGVTTSLPYLAFDGDINTRFFGYPDGTVTFAPATPIPFNSFRLYSVGGSNTVYSWNGNDVNGASSSGAWNDFNFGAGEISADTPLVISSSGSQRPELNAIEITDDNGTRILTNPFTYSSDLFTSPSDANPLANPTDQDFDSGAGPQNAFEQADNRVAEVASTGMWISWIPTGGYKFTNSIQVSTLRATADATVRVTVDGVQTELSYTSGTNPYHWDFSGSGTLERIDITNTSMPEGLYYITIDGQRLVDGVNSSFGANGFHLDFSDPNNLGADRSGNGNDFTANGFDTAYVSSWQNTSVYSDAYTDQLDWTTTRKDSVNIDSWINGFDGDLTTYAFGDNSSGTPINESWMQFRPPNPIQVNTSARIYLQYPHGCKIIDANDNETTITVQEGNLNYWQDLNFTGLLKGIAVQSSSGYAARWAAIEIDGQILSAFASPTYDWMQDSPTQNYATGNPIDALIGGTPSFNWSNANLHGTGQTTGLYHGLASQQWDVDDTNTYYWEVTCESVPSGTYPTVVIFQPWGSVWNQNSFLWSFDNGSARFIDDSGTEVVNESWQSLSQGDVAGLWFDGSTNTIHGQVNGGTINSFVIPDRTRPMRPGFMCPPQNSAVISVNFGQQPFLYQPDGTVALQTQNLPVAPIVNGRDHFQAMIGPGDGLNLGDPGAGPWSSALRIGSGASIVDPALAFDGRTDTYASSQFAPDNSPIFFEPAEGINFTTSVRVWADTTSNIFLNGNNVAQAQPNWVTIATGSGVINSIEIRAISGTPFLNAIEVDNVVLRDLSILSLAQQTFPNGLWWVKDRANTNQHQLVDSVTNAAQGGGNWANTSPTVSQAQAYVAPAGDSVAWCWNSAEPATSGFNIVQYTGQNPTVTTVPHGLPDVPDMIITQAKTGTQRNYAVYHSAVGEGKWLQLNGSDAAASDATMWNNQAPDATNFYVGAANTSNFPGAVYTAYCWTSIPGYSAFGSYMGTGDANGPLIVTGFRPAWVMIKNSNSGPWMLFDSTRSPYNNDVGMSQLTSNTTDIEIQEPQNNIDILSNGFKIRGNGGNSNGGAAKLYAAFAENPFSYPVTAR